MSSPGPRTTLTCHRCKRVGASHELDNEGCRPGDGCALGRTQAAQVERHFTELVYLRDWLRKRTPSDDPGLLALDFVIREYGPELPSLAEVMGILDA